MFSNNFDRDFNFVSGLIKVMFVIIIVGVIGTMLFRGNRMYQNSVNGKPTYEITVPTFDGRHETYLTNEYSYDENKCIVFKDEFGIEQHICGQHSISKW